METIGRWPPRDHRRQNLRPERACMSVRIANAACVRASTKVDMLARVRSEAPAARARRTVFGDLAIDLARHRCINTGYAELSTRAGRRCSSACASPPPLRSASTRRSARGCEATRLPTVTAVPSDFCISATFHTRCPARALAFLPSTVNTRGLPGHEGCRARIFPICCCFSPQPLLDFVSRCRFPRQLCEFAPARLLCRQTINH